MDSKTCKVNDFQLRGHHIVKIVIETGKRRFLHDYQEDDDAQQAK